MKNPGKSCFVKERGNVLKGRHCPLVRYIVRSRKGSKEGLAIGDVFEQFEHKITLGLLLFLLLCGSQAGSQVAFAVAMKFGAVFIDAKIINNKFLAKLVVKV